MSTYSEMISAPVVTIKIPTEPAGIISCAYKLELVPYVIRQVGNSGLLIGTPRTSQLIKEKYPKLLDQEGQPSTISWKSIITRQGEDPDPEKWIENLPELIKWRDVPGAELLAQFLTTDEHRFLTHILNYQSVLIGDYVHKDGFIAFSPILVALLGDSV